MRQLPLLRDMKAMLILMLPIYWQIIQEQELLQGMVILLAPKLWLMAQH